MRGVTIFGIQPNRIVRDRLYMEHVGGRAETSIRLSGARLRRPGCLRLPEALAAALAAVTAAD
jgi:hypothetical protein